jgi:hypothetical protein
MNKISEASIDQNGKFYFNGMFKVIVGALATCLWGVVFWGVTTLTANVITNDKDSKERDDKLQKQLSEQDARIVRLESMAEDLREIKRDVKNLTSNNARLNNR